MYDWTCDDATGYYYVTRDGEPWRAYGPHEVGYAVMNLAAVLNELVEATAKPRIVRPDPGDAPYLIG